MMIVEKTEEQRGVSRSKGDEVASMVTLHKLCGQLAAVEARSAQVHVEMREADTRGARNEVLVLFKEMCDLILLGAGVETEMARILLKAGVEVND